MKKEYLDLLPMLPQGIEEYIFFFQNFFFRIDYINGIINGVLELTHTQLWSANC